MLTLKEKPKIRKLKSNAGNNGNKASKTTHFSLFPVLLAHCGFKEA